MANRRIVQRSGVDRRTRVSKVVPVGTRVIGRRGARIRTKRKGFVPPDDLALQVVWKAKPTSAQQPHVSMPAHPRKILGGLGGSGYKLVYQDTRRRKKDRRKNWPPKK